MNNLKVWASAGCVAGALALCLPAHAATFTFDFESGDLGPWLVGTTCGSGSTTLTPHNGSIMATVQHTGSCQHTLSYDFAYVGSETLSFDMHAIALPASNVFGTVYSGSGVEISFATPLNVVLGKVGFYNLSNPASLPANSFLVDLVQHNYSATLQTFAGLAGLAPAAAISKVNITFIAWGVTGTGNSNSSATVWFDNVTNAVPEPSQLALMWAGLAVVGMAVRRRRLRVGS